MRKYLKVVHDHRAGLGLRIANYFVDYLVVVLFFFLLGVLAVFLNDYLGVSFLYDWVTTLENLSQLEDVLLTTFVTLIYYFLMEHYTGRTIGKYITGTKVISIDGAKPDTTQILYRTLSRVVPFDGLSFAFAENGWHDNWSDTRVVKIKDYHNAVTRDTEINEIGQKVD